MIISDPSYVICVLLTSDLPSTKQTASELTTSYHHFALANRGEQAARPGSPEIPEYPPSNPFTVL